MRLPRPRLRQPSLTECISALVVAASCAFVFSQLQPHLLFQDSMTNGGDMGAHVWAPRYLVDHLLPHGRLTGWTPDWYAGFPALHFYFPLPTVMIALLDIVFPANVAFKLITVSGAVTLPLAMYAFGRLARLPFPVPACLAAFTLPFLFDTGYSILGGNIPSTLAGEFSFSVALSFAVLFLGVVVRGTDTGKHRALASVLLGATILSHILPTIFAFVAGTLIVLLRMARQKRFRRSEEPDAVAKYIVGAECAGGALLLGLAATAPLYAPFAAVPLMAVLALAAVATFVLAFVQSRRALGLYFDVWSPLKWAIPVALTGVALSAWWLLPFIAQSGYMNDMGWEKIGVGTEAGLTIFGEKIVNYGDALFTDARSWLVVVAGAGVIISIFFLRRIGLLFLLLALVAAAAFVFMPQGRLWNARFLPFYFLSLYMLAALLIGELGNGIASMVRSFRDERSQKRSVADDVADGLAITAPLAAMLIALSLIVPRLPEPNWWEPASSTFSALDVWRDPDSQTELNYIPSWAKWNYEGYDGKDDNGEFYKPAGAEYESIMNMLRTAGLQQGCGRVMWEYEPDLDRFGTPMALMLSPLRTKGCMGSMEGLYFESSPTVPYHFLNQRELSNEPSSPMRDIPYASGLDVASGVTKLQLWGVRYYLAVTPEAQQEANVDPRLTLVANTPAAADDAGNQRTWNLYRVAGSDLVTPLQNLPNVLTDPESIQTWRADATAIANGRTPERKKHSAREAWLENTLAWYGNDANYDAPFAADGPKNWPRARTALDPLQYAPVPNPPQVTYVGTGDDHISFRVSEPGKPVLVKTSYFPNWKVKGGKGPYRVTPNLMVVVPTSNNVTLHYGYTAVDIGSTIISLIGLAVVAFMIRRPTRLLAWLDGQRKARMGSR